MTLYGDNETNYDFSFSWEEVYHLVAGAILDQEGCPYEIQVNLLITNDEKIREINKDTRGIDKPTDVLSFPNIEFDVPSDFDIIEENEADYIDPENGEVILGDIIISADRVRAQAKEHGHSEEREFAFLVAHSMYHLCGYDHMTKEDEKIMFEKQELLLTYLRITRE